MGEASGIAHDAYRAWCIMCVSLHDAARMTNEAWSIMHRALDPIILDPISLIPLVLKSQAFAVHVDSKSPEHLQHLQAWTEKEDMQEVVSSLKNKTAKI